MGMAHPSFQFASASGATVFALVSPAAAGFGGLVALALYGLGALNAVLLTMLFAIPLYCVSAATGFAFADAASPLSMANRRALMIVPIAGSAAAGPVIALLLGAGAIAAIGLVMLGALAGAATSVLLLPLVRPPTTPGSGLVLFLFGTLMLLATVWLAYMGIIGIGTSSWQGTYEAGLALVAAAVLVAAVGFAFVAIGASARAVADHQTATDRAIHEVADLAFRADRGALLGAMTIILGAANVLLASVGTFLIIASAPTEVASGTTLHGYFLREAPATITLAGVVLGLGVVQIVGGLAGRAIAPPVRGAPIRTAR